MTLISADMALPARDQDLLQLDKVLTQLAALDAGAARVVELRFFGGLNEEEVAHNLQVSTKTVQRDWKMARAWLVSHLARQEKAATRFLRSMADSCAFTVDCLPRSEMSQNSPALRIVL